MPFFLYLFFCLPQRNPSPNFAETSRRKWPIIPSSSSFSSSSLQSEPKSPNQNPNPNFRPVSSNCATKQSLMFDQFSLSSPKPPFPSSRIFVCFSPKGFTDGTDTIAMSSTSILETIKPFSPFFADRSLRKPVLEPPQPVGLGIAEGLKAEPTRPARTTAVTTGESSREKASARTLSTERWRPMWVNSREHLRNHGLVNSLTFLTRLTLSTDRLIGFTDEERGMLTRFSSVHYLKPYAQLLVTGISAMPSRSIMVSMFTNLGTQ
ncbi:protein MARD1 [Iris pallida]|uniref:Protein MARD1 n=1 Tax=Iris pallida TaxID=29817 RepID=A0AAX6EQT7_IRIPA|nr:protein MARD1 [Iris pallida]